MTGGYPSNKEEFGHRYIQREDEGKSPLRGAIQVQPREMGFKESGHPSPWKKLTLPTPKAASRTGQ